MNLCSYIPHVFTVSHINAKENENQNGLTYLVNSWLIILSVFDTETELAPLCFCTNFCFNEMKIICVEFVRG